MTIWLHGLASILWTLIFVQNLWHRCTRFIEGLHQMVQSLHQMVGNSMKKTTQNRISSLHDVWVLGMSNHALSMTTTSSKVMLSQEFIAQHKKCNSQYEIHYNTTWNIMKDFCLPLNAVWRVDMLKMHWLQQFVRLQALLFRTSRKNIFSSVSTFFREGSYWWHKMNKLNMSHHILFGPFNS